MSFQVITIETLQSADSFKSDCNLAPGDLPALQNLENYIGGVSGGNYPSKIDALVGAVKASGTITSTNTAGNNETMKVANQTITAKTSGAVPANGEFNISATPATQAASIALAINSLPALSGIVTASASLGVVTVTAVVPGVVGNGIELADVDLANVTVVGMSGGSNGTSYSVVNQIS